MRISDWSSDVCSSDLACHGRLAGIHDRHVPIDLACRAQRHAAAFQGHREIIVHQVEVLKKAFYEQAFIDARYDEVMVAPMAVDIQDMHHDGAARHLHQAMWNTEIGKASCREKDGQLVQISEGQGQLNNKQKNTKCT